MNIEIEMFCSLIKVVTVFVVDQFNASLLNLSIYVFFKIVVYNGNGSL